MADHNQQNLKNNNQKQHDNNAADDTLKPCNRFCPTDLGLIACFLKPKFKITCKKNSGKGWFYKKVNVYDYSSDDLTGTWKATRKDTSVCDDVTERVLGRKRCLVYLDKNKRKTPWLMHEYTLNDPIIPFGCRGQYNHKNKMTDWVLCKIYKKETKNQNVNINMADQHLKNLLEILENKFNLQLAAQLASIIIINLGKVQPEVSNFHVVLLVHLQRWCLTRMMGLLIMSMIRTCPAQEAAVQMDTNQNLKTMQQMASKYTSKDKSLPQHVHNLKKSIAKITID
ncbi:NAC domain-containing protein [Artemisia annua]|uniref:NAC domain-containing protein n=1 Tax=Artemisia annua TaxID=35608 RepID=A0A2U1KKV3_ARTAN|nr:NAC domain-containing protein [Artemisia annua]